MGKKPKTRHIMVTRTNSGPSNFDKKELTRKANESLAAEASSVKINRNIHTIEPTVYPAIDKIVNNAFAVIDSEVHKLGRASVSDLDGLSAAQSRHLGVLTKALCQLANLRMDLKERQSMTEWTDERLLASVDWATEAIKGEDEVKRKVIESAREIPSPGDDEDA